MLNSALVWYLAWGLLPAALSIALALQSSYILIFCDHDIQLSEVATGNRNATYSIGEKLIKL